MTGSGEVPPARGAERAGTVAVDGHEFLVRPRPAEPGVYDLDWLTGPNEGYGFSSSGGPLRPAEIERCIRDFLRGIDPRSGYLDRRLDT